MRLVLAALALTAACSNASDPVTPDAPGTTIDAPGTTIDAPGTPDAPASARILVINEVAAAEAPDWFEVVNVSSAPVQLADFVYCDEPDDFVKAKPFPSMMLAPGAYYVQEVSTEISGFGIGGDEELWVYRLADQALSDTVDWDEGAAGPTGSSYARSPDTSGDFATTATPSRGAANP